VTETVLFKSQAPCGGAVRRIRVTDFYNAKRQHERWAMLTSTTSTTAELFDEAGVWALLVGDSAANNVYGTNYAAGHRR
jgi:3-methyl-2-oxobutanoate hydroxymethyltransferase